MGQDVQEVALEDEEKVPLGQSAQGLRPVEEKDPAGQKPVHLSKGPSLFDTQAVHRCC
jgi:hypothetical protein